MRQRDFPGFGVLLPLRSKGVRGGRTCFVDFDHFPTSDEILEYIHDHFTDFCNNGRKVEVAKFYNINMHCVKFYASNDTTATYYLINNIREVNQ